MFESKHTMKNNQSVRQHRMPAESRPHYQPNLPDFSIYRSGSVSLFRPLSPAAQAWLEAHCPQGSDHQYLGQNLAIEFRFVDEIIEHAIKDGLNPATNLLAEGSVK